MAKRNNKKRQSKLREVGELPTPEQLREGSFDRDFVTHAETATKAMTHKRRQSRSALEHMRSRGGLTDEQYYSAQQIAEIAEKIQRSVESRCASMEARVDCAGSGRNALYESLRHVRAEAAYSE